MSNDVEKRVGNLLNNSQPMRTAPDTVPSITTRKEDRQSITAMQPVSGRHTDPSKEELSVKLKKRQENAQVNKQLYDI